MITNWIMTNLQLVSVAVVGLAGGIGALTYARPKNVDANGESFRQVSGPRLRRVSAAVGGLVLLVSALPFIPAGYEGVVFDRRPNSGVNATPRGEGFSFTLPFIESTINMNVRTQLYTVDSNVQTFDLQEVLLPVAVNYRVEDAPFVYQNVGLDYLKQIIDPAVFQATTVAAGQVTAESIAKSRTELTAAVYEALVADLADDGIQVVDVAIRDAVFDKDFIASVKNKVIADQKAQESERLVEVAENEAAQEVKRSEGAATAAANIGAGQAEAITAISNSLKGEAYLEWLSLNKWDGRVPSVVMGDETQAIIPIPEPAPSE